MYSESAEVAREITKEWVVPVLWTVAVFVSVCPTATFPNASEAVTVIEVVGVAVGVAVAVCVAVAVPVAVEVAVAVAVLVAVAVAVAVFVAVAVGVAVGVADAVAVTVGVPVAVAVGIGVAVAVGVGGAALAGATAIKNAKPGLPEGSSPVMEAVRVPVLPVSDWLL
jgi:hypothetical protein